MPREIDPAEAFLEDSHRPGRIDRHAAVALQTQDDLNREGVGPHDGRAGERKDARHQNQTSAHVCSPALDELEGDLTPKDVGVGGVVADARRSVVEGRFLIEKIEHIQ
ncbi:hypothetical protein LTR94_033061, partial [Friedmanniomyces endolithicus]